MKKEFDKQLYFEAAEGVCFCLMDHDGWTGEKWLCAHPPPLWPLLQIAQNMPRVKTRRTPETSKLQMEKSKDGMMQSFLRIFADMLRKGSGTRKHFGDQI